jgi:hypothetical protein
MTKYKKILYLLAEKIYPRLYVKNKDQPLLLRSIQFPWLKYPRWVLGKSKDWGKYGKNMFLELPDENGEDLIAKLVSELAEANLPLNQTTILGLNSEGAFQVNVEVTRVARPYPPDYTFRLKPLNPYEELTLLHTSFEDD